MHKTTPWYAWSTRELLGLFVLWFILWQMNLHLSRDSRSYIEYFHDALKLSLAERLSQMNWLKDPGYFVIQNIGVELLSFSALMAVIVLIAMAAKMMALKFASHQLEGREPNYWIIVPYLCTLSYLHEVTQIRTALATGLLVWAIVFWGQNKIFYAILITLGASLFHASALLFFIPFTIILAAQHLGRWVYFAVLALASILALPDLAPRLMLTMGEAFDLRYLAYIRGAISRTLNTTGLFPYFVFFFITLLGVLWKYGSPTNAYWSQERTLAIVCAFTAIVALQIFRFNTVIASRIADLMLLPMAYVLGTILVDAKKQNKRLFLVLFAILLAYALARGYVTLSPRAPPLMPTVD